MNFKIVTALPQLLEGPLNHSIMQRGQDKGLLQIELVNLREYGLGPHKQIDDYQFGGGAGMVMMCEPLASCIEDLCSKAEFDEIIYLTPDGEKFNQKLANQLSLKKNIMLICGHYKGIDERIREKYVS
ncbi:MAG: tRNA (guanosine(37)-N1)-methyltransferase TrmD, partial [Bacteroidetes bacterium]|nr:tRNA (guanosine(37)-N1)-methyltransferase TrmD [Bacteroidota bacterium]